MKDLYYILGTDRNCTTSELNAAYQKLARKLQPDETNPDHFFEDLFKEITEAYQILSDPNQRRKYDAAFKKNHQRRLYYFKIKHLNVTASLALLLFTGLFGWYVIEMLGGRNTQKKSGAKTPNVSMSAATPPRTVHRWKKHKAKLEAPVINRPTLPARDTGVHHSTQEAPPFSSKPIVIQDDTALIQQSVTYCTYLQANASGVIYLHQSPNYTSAVLTKIPDHSKVTVTEKGRQFYKVIFEDQHGYVAKWTIVDP